MNGSTPDPAVVTVSIANAPADAQFIGGGYTPQGISQITLDWSQQTQATVTVNFKAPYNLAPGTYRDTLHLALCKDSACANEIAGSRATMTITYTVTAPAAQAMPRVWVDTSQIAVAGLTTGAVVSVAPGTDIGGIQIPIHATNVAYPVAVSTQSTTNTIVSASASPAFNGLEAMLYVQLKYPSDLGVGSFHDTIQISACLDAACINPVTTSPLTVTVDYVVSDHVTVTGNNGYTMRFVLIPNSTGLVADPTRDLLYVVQLNGSTSLVKSVTPSTGAIAAQLTAPALFTGRTLRMSADGKYVYTPSFTYYGIYRFLLPDWTLDTTIPFESNALTGGYDTADLQLVPGTNDSLVVARTYGGAYGEPADVVAYDGAVKRSNSVVTPYAGSGPNAAFLEWGADNATLYGASPPGVVRNSWRFAVDANGVTLPAAPLGLGGGPMAYASGKLFFANNDGLLVLDATTGTQLATPLPPVAYLSGVLADPALGRVYALGADMQGQSVLYVVDVQTLLVLGSTTFDSAYHPAGKMVRWGSNGLAVADSTLLLLLSGPLIAP